MNSKRLPPARPPTVEELRADLAALRARPSSAETDAAKADLKRRVRDASAPRDGTEDENQPTPKTLRHAREEKRREEKKRERKERNGRASERNGRASERNGRASERNGRASEKNICERRRRTSERRRGTSERRA